MHFNLTELEEYPEIRAIAQKLFISHLLMFLVTIINFVSCLIQGFAIEGEGIRILYSIICNAIFFTLVINQLLMMLNYLLELKF